MDMDISTLDLDKLEKLPAYKNLKTRHLSHSMGQGCYLDAPGYPSYFLRSIYTQNGNTPRTGPDTELLGHTLPDFWEGAQDWDERKAKCDAFLHRLWKPLPLDHPRVQAWMKHVYNHFKHCYADVEGIEPLEYGKPAMLIYPIPSYRKHKTHIPAHLVKYTNMPLIEREDAEINGKKEERYAAVCTPDNHMAVRYIRKFYPNAPVMQEWIDVPPQGEGNWYERYAERPTPDACPGDEHVGLPHNTTGWCQFCGYIEHAS